MNNVIWKEYLVNLRKDLNIVILLMKFEYGKVDFRNLKEFG